MAELKHEEYTYAFLGCAMAVHRELGPGFDECYYHAALRDAMNGKGI